MGDLEEVVVVGLRTLKIHRRRPQEEPDDAPAAMPFGKTAPLFGPKTPSPPPFNPDLDGDGDSDVSHDPMRKEDKPKEIEVPDALEGDIPPSNDDSGNDDGGSGNDATGSGDDDSGSGDDKGGQTSSNLPDATEIDLPPANAPPTSTTETPDETPTPPPPPPAGTTTKPPELNEQTTTSRSRSERTTSSFGPRETYPSDTQPAEAHESSTSHSWTRTGTSTITDMTESPTTTSCITITHCSTNTLYPYETTCYYETTFPFTIEKELEEESEDIGNILKDTGKLIAVILVTMIMSVLLTVGFIWAYKRRARKRRGKQGRERIGGDVEGGSEKRRKFWGVLGKKNGRVGSEKAVAVRAGNAPAAEQAEVPVPPEMTQRNQRLSIILPPGQSGHRHRMSNNTILDRTLSVASSLTVPPYPGSLAASGTTRSNSTRTARSVSSNITDDTVVRTKREYQSTVNRLAEENMHSDHAVVADGFHLAPPNPFEEEGPGVAGSNGMGGNGVGIGGLGAVDGEGNRRVVICPPPPVIRVGDDMNPFEDPDMDLDMGAADGFRPNGGGRMMHGGSGMRHPPPPPPRLENPFEDGLGGYQDVDVGLGDGFEGYVPGQMGDMGDENATPVQRRVSMRGGDSRRRVSGDGISIVSSTSGESLSSNETLRGDWGDLEDWNDGGGDGGRGGSGGHAGHGHVGTRRI